NGVLTKEVDAGLVEEGDQRAPFETVGEFYDAEEGSLIYDEFADETDAYLIARDNLATFNAAVEAYEEAASLAAGLEEQDAAVEAAYEAIVELGYEVIDLALPEDAAADDVVEVAGTDDNDLFVFLGEDALIDLFGEVGDDLLFIGSEYTFNGDIE